MTIGFERLISDIRTIDNALNLFKTYHDFEEGWSKEYDGVDPGYLSATISFLGKIYQENNCRYG